MKIESCRNKQVTFHYDANHASENYLIEVFLSLYKQYMIDDVLPHNWKIPKGKSKYDKNFERIENDDSVYKLI